MARTTAANARAVPVVPEARPRARTASRRPLTVEIDPALRVSLIEGLGQIDGALEARDCGTARRILAQLMQRLSHL